MSFYDLTKDGVLRPEDLFKYRTKRDSTILSKGGQKEFEPDGSWIQNKQLEAFLQERTSILTEARVEKLKNVVEGMWDEEKKLVNLKKPGKFWMHMGFTDERRNWLYPEEALLLMEMNTLELYHKGRPMSIQEGYVKMLGRGICLEEYQVFSHLRRLGFVVIRHEEEKIFTDYERQINLDQYYDKKKIRERLKKGKGKSSKKVSHSDKNNDTGKHQDNFKSDTTTHLSTADISAKDEDKNLNGSLDASTCSSTLCSKRNLENDSDDASNKRLKSSSLENGEICSEGSESHNETDSSSFYNNSSWSSCFKKNSTNCITEVNHQSHKLSKTVLHSGSIDLFPDVAQNSTTLLQSPPLNLLPPDSEVTQIDIDRTIEQVKGSSQQLHHETNFVKEDPGKKIFSCLNGLCKQPKIKAGSWSEYKRKKSEMLDQISTTSLVEHLWKDTAVTPLMHPTEITSYGDVMDRLQIIQSANNEDLVPDVSNLATLPKICFDVHLPDHCFKKSMPGIPDHRVCVTRSDGVPPSLNAIQHFYNKYKDNVPLHWAVVDSGEIAFYVFDQSKSVEVLGV